MSTIKPPLGVLPKRFRDEERLQELSTAIIRYVQVNKPVPMVWMGEYNVLCRRINKRSEEEREKELTKSIGTVGSVVGMTPTGLKHFDKESEIIEVVKRTNNDPFEEQLYF